MTSLARFASALAALSLLAAGCDQPLPTDPDAGVDGGLALDARVFPDGTVRCETDAECDDGVSCTEDSCLLPGGVCRNAVVQSACDDGIFCNGQETCDPVRGCVPPAMRETCNDDEVCTLDRCDEETDTCEHFPRDLDEDGDVDFFCAGGGDCDDRDRTVSSMTNEVCGDFVDNDCDAEVDEPDCGAPPHDVCEDPLDVSAGGFFLLDTTGAIGDYPTSCGGGGPDLVASFTLTEPRSVEIEGEGEFFTVALSLRTDCDDSTTELACENSFPSVIRRRSLGPGTYYVLASSSFPGEIELNVQFGDPLPHPSNETCATPIAIDPATGGTFEESFAEVGDDTTTSCGFSGSPDLVYRFTTTAEQDVEITALATSTGDGLVWALRSSCADPGTDLRCAYGRPAAGRIHQLPAGTYYLVVEGPSWAPVDFTLDVRFLPPTPPAAGDTCANALPLELGTTTTGSLTDKEDDIDVSCGFFYRDVVHTFSLETASDVTVELDPSGFGALAVVSACGGPELRCTTGTPAQTNILNLPAGTYYVVAESSPPGGYSLRVDATTPPTVATEVSGNDDCTSAYVLPATGGLFHGNTATLGNDFTSASCASVTGNDAVFELTLGSTQHVVLSTDESVFDTVLLVHRDTCTDGAELYCDDDGGGDALTSRIDRVLDAGTYYIVVDGLFASGEYFLEVTVSDP